VREKGAAELYVCEPLAASYKHLIAREIVRGAEGQLRHRLKSFANLSGYVAR